VHEAAGHAPIIANPEYAEYLKQYAQVAKKAIISREDLEVYKAIRELSDIKENPVSTDRQIKDAEAYLARVVQSVKNVSEAAELSRMNWWTAEYGLIGPLNSPKIFGAGLLSSVGESRWCLSDKVKKIPLSLACIRQSYDITEPQPQLFVARDFQHLADVLDELSATMAYRTGGKPALQKAVQAESINTVEFENGLQISGVLKNFMTDPEGKPAYLQFNGPTQLSQNGNQLAGHSPSYHKDGYGTPVGKIENFSVSDLQIQKPLSLNYKSGVHVEGTLTGILRSGDATVLTLASATASFKGETLFKPEWGAYDIVLANEVVSVWGGPADRPAFGEIDDFVASRVQPPSYSKAQHEIFSFYHETSQLRSASPTAADVAALFAKFRERAPEQWLLFLELLEIAVLRDFDQSLVSQLDAHLKTLPQNSVIEDGLKLAYAKY
jgi:phenylalanine-4-hydroxylase